MAARGPRTGGGHRQADGARGGRARAADPAAPDAAVVRIRDLAGRPRGTGFVADHHGTVITSHEAVDGLARLVLHAAGDRTCLVTADAVTPLPALDLALVRTEGLDVDPLPVTARERVESGTYVRVAAGCWREARVLHATSVTYAATDRFHLLEEALELAIGTDGRDALRLGGGAAGGPVLDAGTGAVVGVLGTALHSGHRDVGFAVPLLPAPDGPLADLLARNAATVPAYGPDLNLAGVLALTATSVGQDGPAPAGRAGDAVEPVERDAVAREFAAFMGGPATVLGLVGAPGSGRTTELASLAARRARGAAPAPTLWLRGADLKDDDTSVADAARRALTRAARIVAASGPGGGLGDITPERLAGAARAAGRPLLLLLDGPEEMPPAPAHHLRQWARGTASWLGETGARLAVACRAEYWERAGAQFPEGSLYAGPAPGGLPPCLRLGDLLPDEARTARARYGIPEGVLEDADARHPLTLRLLSEVGAALPGAPHARVDRDDVFSAHLDLMCLRVAVRLAAGNGLRGTAVRRLAAKVAGQVHEAARRSLGSGQGELDRGTFEALFPWGPAPARLGGGAGWASAVLTEGLLVPAGSGYRFAHEELADWIQGMHLDLDEALEALVHRPAPDGGPVPAVPHHRIGPVVQALLLLARQHGPHRLADRLRELAHALDTGPRSWWPARLLTETLLRVPDARPYEPVLSLLVDRLVAARGQDGGRDGVASWGDGGRFGASYRGDGGRFGAASQEDGGRFGVAFRGNGGRFGAASQEDDDRFAVASGRYGSAVVSLEDGDGPAEAHREEGDGPGAVFRQEGDGHGAVLREESDGPAEAYPEEVGGQRAVFPEEGGGPGSVFREEGDRRPAAELLTAFGPGFWIALALPQADRIDLLRRLLLADGPPQEPGLRFLDAVSHLLAADPAGVQPLLTHWFDDDRPLPATPHATVAEAAQALLHTHRHLALDGLTEVLLDSAHRRADELLAVLAEDEPSAMCRAVDRWAHDERPARRVAAVTYGLCAAPHVRSGADRELLRYAALALLARPADAPLHGGALALLVRDPRTRARHLPRALRHFVADDPRFPPSALVPALATHPEPVLDAFRERLRGPDAGRVLRTLADITTPTLARRAAALVREAVRGRPETAADVAAYVDRRLDQGPTARAVLLPLVTGLLDGGPEEVRAALAAVLAAPGAPASRPMRRELLDVLLTHEQAPAVLDALLHATGRRAGDDTRELVHRTGLLLVRTPDGAARFDRGLVDLARHVPGFAARVTGWLADAPQDWAAVVGPSARRTIENLAGVRVPA
ncbi:trypsin-like peptidase domain-containing protein [Streptomyces sediminimaris]|uniref:trypsin-like peptidase domain-containing protein n=1 Tax=Streptomyces sediminimaris TaxID=3383721 RepID=UPI003999A901